MKRFKTQYPGVFYRETKRIGDSGTEKVFYIVFKKDGKIYEEKAGRQFVDDMSAPRAARIRGELIEGKRKSRLKQKEEKKAIEDRWTIEKLWEAYKNNHHILKGLIQDECRFKKYIEPSLGKKEPLELVPLDVDRLRIKFMKTMKPATVRNVLELLRRIINHAAKKRLCQIPDFKIEMPEVNNIKTEDLSTDQLNALLKAIDKSTDSTAANLMRMVLFTGMRRGELFHLKWPDVDFEKSFIHLVDPKSGTDERIPLNEAARSVLKSIKRTSEYVFPNKSGQRLTDIAKAVNLIKKAAGLPKDFRPLHGLRHFYAATLASSGQVDMYTLQKLLTHKSPMMTQRYAHLRDETLRSASNLAGKLIKIHKKKHNTDMAQIIS
ncbi:MAG: Tyrosine recombinase XerD [Smithella sp. PtaU1.Bin162]|nr:MAG: Tyrosine recombinase XerD [Smithella sp. PtaU1.Bin162]